MYEMQYQIASQTHVAQVLLLQLFAVFLLPFYIKK